MDGVFFPQVERIIHSDLRKEPVVFAIGNADLAHSFGVHFVQLQQPLELLLQAWRIGELHFEPELGSHRFHLLRVGRKPPVPSLCQLAMKPCALYEWVRQDRQSLQRTS